MANLITQTEIMKYQGIEKALFPKGTIITPSAKDWAKEHKINIVIEDTFVSEGNSKSVTDTKGSSAVKNETVFNKEELLDKTIRTVIIECQKRGMPIISSEMTEIVVECLKRMNYKVE